MGLGSAFFHGERELCVFWGWRGFSFWFGCLAGWRGSWCLCRGLAGFALRVGLERGVGAGLGSRRVWIWLGFRIWFRGGDEERQDRRLGFASFEYEVSTLSPSPFSENS